MIFAGDVALPCSKIIEWKDFPELLCRKDWFINLEGGIISGDDIEFRRQRKVYNSIQGLESLQSQIQVKYAALANNHILDVTSIEKTQASLKKLGIRFLGAGCSLETARKHIRIQEGKFSYSIVNLGWVAVNCRSATAKREGVYPYTVENVIAAVKRILAEEKDSRIICFFHWNYELELYPQPLDRDLARELIDMGVFAVIGCHAHRVQGIEMYKGHPIVYGLGNFLFPQNFFWKGRLSFPDFTKLEMAFEITEESEFLCHFFEYDRAYQRVTYLKSEPPEKSEIIQKLTNFHLLNSQEYDSWYKKNRTVNKMLPVFYYTDSRLRVEIKLFQVYIWNYAIKIISRFPWLFRQIKKLMRRK